MSKEHIWPDGKPEDKNDVSRCSYEIDGNVYLYTMKQINNHIDSKGYFQPYIPLLVSKKIA